MVMGRVSKRQAALRKTEQGRGSSDQKTKRYQAGIYARISANHSGRSGDGASKSESIEIQLEIAKAFIEEFNQEKNGAFIELKECYTDRGKSGSDFEREGFQRLLKDIRLGEINCVIVKDLSRLGRNYLEAGNYIERIFPFLGVRFIAVVDEFDTGKTENEEKQLTYQIKNLVNDMYAKDFSKKARLQLRQRREEGSYVGGAPPYGYRTEWNGRRRILIPDEKTAAIVRLIYERFAETGSHKAVMDELYRRRVNPPSGYRKTGRVYALPGEEYKAWDKSGVKRILGSETYTGTLVQGKTGITGRNEKNRIHKPKEEWIITENAQEALIEKELYQQVRDLQKNRREAR